MASRRLVLTCVALLVGWIVIASVAGSAAAAPVETTYQNPVSAAPPLVRPSTAHCTVTLAADHPFGPSGYDTPATGALTLPTACPAPWSMVALDWTGSVAGRQFDREAEIWLGGVEIYYGTTPEPTPAGIAWHVEKDISEYAPAFTDGASFAIHVPNVVNSVYTGVIYVTANLTFYETGAGWPAAPHPSAVVGLSGNWMFDPGRSWVSAAPVSLPTNPDRVVLEVFAKGNSCDEFWYASEPDAYANTFGLCGGGAFREIQVAIDGTTVGVVWPFPYIFTGGINPLLWRPVSAVDAFNEPPYALDLTPFASLLADGEPHTVSFLVVNNGFYWQLGGNLLVWQDPTLSHTTGAVLGVSVPADATQSVVTTVNSTSATFAFAASRTSSVSGYVDTGAGRVTITVDQTFAFASHQILNLVNFLENVMGSETIVTRETVASPSGTTVTTTEDSYPIAMTSAFIIPLGPNPQRFLLPATVAQSFERTVTVMAGDGTTAWSTLDDSVHAEAVLAESLSTGAHVIASGHDYEDYVAADSAGLCYNHLIQAANGFVTADMMLPTC